jgi:hypothetical protein
MRFTLERGQWFGLSMFPGYADAPYHSPIRVDAVKPLGDGCMELKFLNLGYAAGVRDFTRRFRILRRGSAHIVLEATERPDRTYVICALNRSWIAHCCSALAEHSEQLFDTDGEPIPDAFVRLGG